jgi:hypothetical protein
MTAISIGIPPFLPESVCIPYVDGGEGSSLPLIFVLACEISVDIPGAMQDAYDMKDVTYIAEEDYVIAIGIISQTR